MMRNERDTLDKGDLVRVMSGDGTFGKTTYRLLGFIDHADGTVTAWIGPSSLTPREVDEFEHELQMGQARRGKFKGCVPIDAGRLDKILDS